MGNKITLKEFWNSKKKLAIHCNTEEKADKLLEAFDKYGERWYGDYRYIDDTYWNDEKENTCYSNRHGYSSIDWYKANDLKIYEFDEVDLDN